MTLTSAPTRRHVRAPDELGVAVARGVVDEERAAAGRAEQEPEIQRFAQSLGQL
jgi:hypothetical protein